MTISNLRHGGKGRPSTGNPLFSTPTSPQADFRRRLDDKIASAAPGDTELLNITPDIARVMLERNSNNRNVRQFHVEVIGRAIKDGRYRFTGQTISFTKSGKMNDGQHRCLAGIFADAPFRSLIAYAVDDEAFAVTDTGIKRGPADAVKHTFGTPDAKTAASVARVVYYIKTGQIRANSVVMNDEIIRTLEEEPQVFESASIGASAYNRSKLGRASVLGGLHYLLAEVHKAEAARFMELVATGENLPAGDAILMYRKWLLKIRSDRSVYTNAEYLAVGIKAWNAWRRGKEVKLLKYIAGEAFPSPV